MISVITGDALTELKKLASGSVNCCVTSPPYFGLRDYGVDGQIGLEKTPDEYVAALVEIFREVKRVLRDDGTLWLNLGDSYAGSNKGVMANGSIVGGAKQRTSAGTMLGNIAKAIKYDGIKPKDLIGIPWRVAFALQADGWYLRQDIIWHKPNPMPESVTDRCTKAHEYVFLLSKSARYYYDAEAIKEPIISPARTKEKNNGESAVDTKKRGFGTHCGTYSDGRNKRSVWTVPTKCYPEAHFATYPPELIIPCIKAGCPEGGTVLDPFAGSGTTMEVASRLGRNSIGIEINPEYSKLIETRCHEWIFGQNLFEEVTT